MGAALGIYTNNCAKPFLSAVSTDVLAPSIRFRRFHLQAVARMILPHRFRMKKCYQVPIKNRVEVWSREKGGGSLSGICICGSLWTCPVCSARISEHRRKDLQQGVSGWEGEGGSVMLLTLTFPHVVSDRLLETYPKFGSAMTRFQKHRTFRQWASDHGLKHRVRASEITHGANGWHPHAHVLLFLDRPVAQEAVSSLFDAWSAACRLAGLGSPSRANGIDLRNGSHAAAYAAKWGLAHELTKGHSKRGRAGSRTPFDLLACHADTGDMLDARLFREYAQATFRRPQLQWSYGSRAALGLKKELTDEEAAKGETTPADVLLATMTNEQFRLVVRARAQCDLIDLANDGDPFAVQAFIRSLL